VDERAFRRIPVSVDIAGERTRAELAAAVALVVAGDANRVALTNLSIDDALAGEGAALAQRAHVAFSVARDAETGRRVITVGPRLTR
jgi:hypothetical protein